MSRPRLIVGVDLGQVTDPTAIIVAEVHGLREAARYDVRHIERHLGKTYPFIVARVRALAAVLAGIGDVTIGFDQTGVGRAVGDLLRQADIPAPLHGISISSGEAVTQEGGEFRVPKKDLVGVLQIAFQNGRIRIAKALPLAGLVARELTNFKVRVTESANEVFDGGASHDDFVIALALLVWLDQYLNRGRAGGWVDPDLVEAYATMDDDSMLKALREEDLAIERELDEEDDALGVSEVE